MYNNENIFAKILRGEVSCDKIYEDQYVYCFEDINPQAPVHLLVIPKGPYTCYSDFVARASSEEILAFFRAIEKITSIAKLDQNGYRLITNNGADADQLVPHFHFHILAGKKLGPKIVE